MRKKFLIGIPLAIACSFLIAWLLPLPKALEANGVSTTKILDRNGTLLYEQRFGGIQEDIALSKVPEDIIDALLATEDRTFWTNPGVSLRGTARAILHDLQAGKIIEGGSTITQQLVRNKLRPARRGLLYKIREAWLAVKLTSTKPKDAILSDYLNSSYFGQQTYGIAAASKAYFGKNLSELSLGESALLIGLLNAPSSLNPFKDPAAAIKRRSTVLSSMLQTGRITDEELENAHREPIHLSHGKALIRAPHFVMWLLSERAGEWEGLEEVRTTLDADLQTEIESIVANKLQALIDKNVTSAAVVVLDAKSGDLLGMVGSADYFDDERDGQVNSALAARQPGSAIKPFTYALAFANGQTAATTVADTESEFPTQEGTTYTPRNYDYQYHGLVRLREALGNSYNIAAIKVLESIGVASLLSFLQRLGLSTLTEGPEHYGLALTLGDSEVRLLELARAYAIFPRAGRLLTLRTLLTDQVTEGEQVLDPNVSWLVADILSDNDARASEFGRSSPLSFSYPVAAKTGTTRNSRDNWTIGFTASRIVGVWVGNADNSPMKGTSGITGAAPIFHDVVLAAMRNEPKTGFQRPAGIIQRTVCRLSGKLMTKDCPASIDEVFIEGTEPKESDEMFRQVTIDMRNGLLATDRCGSKFIRMEVFPFFPPDMRMWARENGWPSPPTAYSPLCSGSQSIASSSDQDVFLHITSPGNAASYLLDPLVPDTHEKILLEASASSGIQKVEWKVNGKTVGFGSAPDFRFYWELSEGVSIIEVRADGQSDSVTIEVTK